MKSLKLLLRALAFFAMLLFVNLSFSQDQNRPSGKSYRISDGNYDKVRLNHDNIKDLMNFDEFSFSTWIKVDELKEGTTVKLCEIKTHRLKHKHLAEEFLTLHLLREGGKNHIKIRYRTYKDRGIIEGKKEVTQYDFTEWTNIRWYRSNSKQYLEINGNIWTSLLSWPTWLRHSAETSIEIGGGNWSGYLDETIIVGDRLLNDWRGSAYDGLGKFYNQGTENTANFNDGCLMHLTYEESFLTNQGYHLYWYFNWLKLANEIRSFHYPISTNRYVTHDAIGGAQITASNNLCDHIALNISTDLTKSHQSPSTFHIYRKLVNEGDDKYTLIGTATPDQNGDATFDDYEIKTGGGQQYTYVFNLWTATDFYSWQDLGRNTATGQTLNSSYLTDIKHNFLFDKEDKAAVKISWLPHGNHGNSYEVSKNGNELNTTIHSEGNRKYFLDNSLQANQTYTYAFKVSGSCSDASTGTASVQIPQATPLETPVVRVDSSKNGLVSFNWQHPTFNQTIVTKRNKYIFNNTIDIDNGDEFYKDQYTMAAWFKTSDGYGAKRKIIDMWNILRWKMEFTRVTEQKIKLEFAGIDDNNQGFGLPMDIDMNGTGNWYHLAVSYDNGLFKIYVNGKLVGGQDTPGVPASCHTCGPPIFGSSNTSVDEFYYFDKVLTEPDIQKLQAFKSASHQPIVYYDMSSKSGATLQNLKNGSKFFATISSGDQGSYTDQITLNGTQHVGYKIKIGSEVIATVKNSAINNGSFSYTDKDPTPCKETPYQIIPVFAAGDGTPAEVKVTVRPQYVVSGVSASDAAYFDKIKVSWDDVNGEEGYRVYRESQLIAELSSNTLEYLDENALPGTFYKYEVVAFSACSESDLTSASSDVGYIQTLGQISGIVKGPKGSPVANAKVEASPVLGTSLELSVGNDNLWIGYENKVLPEYVQDKEFGLTFWAKPKEEISTTLMTEFEFPSQEMHGSGQIHSSHHHYKLYQEADGKRYFKFYFGFNGDFTSKKIIVEEGKWHHYGIYVKGNQVYIYTDGKLKDTIEINRHFLSLTKGDFAKLHHKEGGNVLLDDIAIWGKQPSNLLDSTRYTNLLSGEEEGLATYLRCDENIESGYVNAQEVPLSNKLINLSKLTNDHVKGNDLTNLNPANVRFNPENVPYLKNVAYTDIKGVFKLVNVNYGTVQGESFVLTASKISEFLEHDITPDYKQASLSADNRVRDGIEFTDETLYPVYGYVWYEEKLPTTAYRTPPFLANARVLIDGKEPASPVITDENGKWFAEVEPGFHVFSMKPYERVRRIVSDSIQVDGTSGTDSTMYEKFIVSNTVPQSYKDVQVGDTAYKILVADGEPWVNVNFFNTASYDLDVEVKGRCDFAVAQRFGIKLESTDNSIKHVYNAADLGSSFQKVTLENLPPKSYKITIILDQNLGIKLDPQQVSLEEGDTSLVFTYRAPLQMEVQEQHFTPIQRSAFESNNSWTGVPLLDKGSNDMYLAKNKDQIELSIDVFEEYNGKRCPVDSALVNIINSLGESSEVLFSDWHTPAKGTKKPAFSKIAKAKVGEPNLTGDHTKKIQVTATDPVGRIANKEFDVVVLGSKKTEFGFSTKISTIPLMWLPDPPGDMSYSYIEKGQELCSSISFNMLSEDGNGFGLEIDRIPDLEFETSLGLAPGIDLSADMEFVGGVTTEWTSTSITETSEEIEVCAAFNERIQTSDDNLIVGKDADVFVGSGLNILFGKSLDVIYSWQGDSLYVPKLPRPVISGDTVQTLYVFTRLSIENTLIPNEEYLIASYRSSLDSVKFGQVAKRDTFPDHLKWVSHRNSLTQWQEIIKWNDYSQFKARVNIEDQDQLNDNLLIWNTVNGNVSQDNKQAIEGAATFIRKNISFGYGSNYDMNFDLSRDSTYTIEKGKVIDHSEVINLGAMIMGAGIMSDIIFTSSEYEGTAQSLGNSKSISTGFFLSDKDPLDYFSVNVLRDPRRGSFYFETFGGASMCPWEEGTMARENIKVDGSLDVKKSITNIPFDDQAIFTMEVGNESETNEVGKYAVILDPHTNPDGLSFVVNGVEMNGEGMQLDVPPLTDASGGVTKVTIVATRSKKDVYDYKDIRFRMISQCELDRTPLDVTGVTDENGKSAEAEVHLSFYWDKPCLKGLEFDKDDDLWMINLDSTSNSFYTNLSTSNIKNDIDTRLKQLDFQYALLNSTSWTSVSAFKMTKDKFLDNGNVKNSHAYQWSASDLVDGEYKVRLNATCLDGTSNASNVLSGRIARNSTMVLGTPKPNNGIYRSGDEVEVEFTNSLQCNLIKPFSQYNISGTFPGTRYKLFANSLQLNGNNSKAILSDNVLEQIPTMATDNFMTSFWVKPEDLTGQKTMLSTDGWKISTENQTVVFEITKADGNVLRATSPSGLRLNEWNFVWAKVIQNSTNTAIQISTSQQINKYGESNSPKTALRTTEDADLVIGGSNSFKGYIDEIRFWDIDGFNRAFTKSQVLVSGGVGILAVWRMDNPNENYPQLNAGVVRSNEVPQWQKELEDYDDILNATVNVSCHENTLRFALPTDLHTQRMLENVPLTVSLSKLFDIYDNPVIEYLGAKPENPIEWSFTNNANPLRWELPSVDVAGIVGKEHTFTMNLWNDGGVKEDFEFIYLPSWIEASPSTGEILAGGKKEITFSIKSTVNAGNYKDEAFVESHGGWEPLLINLNMLCSPPDFSFDAKVYENKMQTVVTIQEEINATILDHYTIAAYINGKPRGTAELVQEGSDYKAYLIISGSNEDKNKAVSFHLWDAKNCKEKIADQTLVFNADQLAKNNLTFTGKIIRNIELNKGWNWVSFGVSSTQTSNSNAGNINNLLIGNNTGNLIVKDAQAFNTYSNGQWGAGASLQNLNNTHGYKVYSPSEQSIRIVGYEADVSQNPVTHKAGWNLIGYFPNYISDISKVMNYSGIRNGDVIKGEDAFAYYEDGYWKGSLVTLEPHKSYKLFAQSDGDFKYLEQKFATDQNQRIATPTIDINKFQETMSIMAQPDFDLINNGTLEAYVGDELRGTATFSELDKLYYLTVSGDQDEKITFKIVNDNQVIAVINDLSFDKDGVLGSPLDPYQLITQTNLVDLKPFIKEIPVQQVKQGETFSIIDLTKYLMLSDKDKVTWSIISDGKELSFDLVEELGLLTVNYPHKSWEGAEKVTITVTDVTDNKLSHSTNVVFVVGDGDHAELVNSTIDKLGIEKDKLYPPYPNPFHENTTISFDIATETNVQLLLFDQQGKQQEILLQQHLNRGNYTYQLNRELNSMTLATGVYLVKLVTASGSVFTQKIIIQ